jgi:hypothetical protein
MWDIDKDKNRKIKEKISDGRTQQLLQIQWIAE